MGDADVSCEALAWLLAHAPDEPLPIPLPYPPLTILGELHRIVANTMASNAPLAKAAATAAQAIVDSVPNDPLRPLLLAQLHWSKGSAILFDPQYECSLKHYDEALRWYSLACEQAGTLTLQPDVRVVQAVRVFCLSELGRYAEAQEAVRATEAWLRDHPIDRVRLTLLLNQSQLASRMGRFRDVIDLAGRAAQLADQLSDPSRKARALVNRANARILQGQFNEAIDDLNRIAALGDAVDSLTLDRAQLNRALLLRLQGQMYSAFTTLYAAEERLLDVAPNEAAILALDKAEIYEQIHAWPDAYALAQRAAQLFAAQSMMNYAINAELRAARIAVQQGALLNAQKHVAQITRQIKLLGTQGVKAVKDLLTAELELVKAQIMVSRIEPPDLHEVHQALVAVRKAVKRFQTHQLAHEVVAGKIISAALAARTAESEETALALALYMDLVNYPQQQIQLAANAALGALLPCEEALSYLQRAAAIAVAQRRTLQMEELQARYSTETAPHHRRLAACYLELGAVVEAFECMGAAKAGSLLDIRTMSHMLDEATQNKLETAKANVAYWGRVAEEQQRAAEYAKLQGQAESYQVAFDQANEARTHIQQHEDHLMTLMRSLGDRGGQAALPDMLAIQSALEPTTLLLEYAQSGDELICFLVRRNTPVVCRRLGPYTTILRILERWNMVRRDPTRFTVLASLWNILIKPWSEELESATRLLIAPWGATYQVPWAMLFDGQRYLGDLVTITLTPAGAFWAAPMRATSAVCDPPRLLGFAGQGTSFLPNVAQELAAIQEYFPDAYVSATATTKDVSKQPAPRILHIAAHGHTHARIPLYSTITLADRPLLLLDAHRLDLHGTELVVLSACETAERPEYGDMILALAGAFLCAGAQAVLASLWKVKDTATAALMKEFYAARMTSVSDAAALQYAQQQVRDTYPYDWAAFQLMAGTHTIKRIT